jgi:hypothetical protein
LLAPDRAARLVEQKALDPALLSLEDVIDAIATATFSAQVRNPYEAEVKRATERVFVDELIDLAGSAPMSQVRAVATMKLSRLAADLGRLSAATNGQSAGIEAHALLLAMDIKRFLERPATAVAVRMPVPLIPPGAPIGEPAMEWLRRVEPSCEEVPPH